MARHINPESCCPICGNVIRKKGIHRCAESQLRAIDAANTRIGNEDLDPWSNEPFGRTYDRRLAEGFELLEQTGDSDE